MKNIIAWLRSILFYCGYHSVLVVISIAQFFITPFLSFNQRYWFLTRWNHFVLFWLRICCRVHYCVAGLENIPNKPCVILSNHQSPWETVYLQTIFSPLTTILKKELLSIPFFGWSLKKLEPIAIDRSNPREALRQIITEGSARLMANRYLLVFPEGTRMEYGQHGNYARGGASVAKAAGVDLLFIAHDAGKCWPAHSITKYPGTINITISQPNNSTELTASELTEQARNWIEDRLKSYPKSKSASASNNIEVG